MKICIPTEDEQGLRSRSFAHYGSAPYFTVVDTGSDAVEVVPVTHRHEHRKHCHHINELRRHGVEAVVCDHVGRAAYGALQRAGIVLLAPGGDTVAEIAETIRSGEVEKLRRDEARGSSRGRLAADALVGGRAGHEASHRPDYAAASAATAPGRNRMRGDRS